MPSICSPPTQAQLRGACNRFFTALATDASALNLLSYFSTTQEVAVQHYPASCPHPHTSLLRGSNAIRSYFDLLATHWTRSNLVQHSVSPDPATRSVVVKASVVWTWKQSGHKWKEEFICTLMFDDSLQIVSLTVRTESGPGTCVMRAVDPQSKFVERPSIQIAVSATVPDISILLTPMTDVPYYSQM
jgi:hypothetical protein